MTREVLNQQRRMQFRCPPFKETFQDKIGIVLLPNRKVCINGQKIGNVRVPDHPVAQQKILLGIAIWFSPCIRTATETDTIRCIKLQSSRLSKVNRMNITFLHKLIMIFLNLQRKGRFQETQDLIDM